MKKITIFVLALALTLTLTSCGLLEDLIGGILGDGKTNSDTDAPAEDNRAITKMTDAALEALLAQGFEKPAEEDEDSGERTIEELLQALRDEEPMTDASGAEYGALPQTFSVDLTEMAALQGTTVQFSEEPWETDKTVETMDMEEFTAEMTPEEKAEWDEMMSMTEEDWAAQIAEMEAEMEELTNSMGEMDAGGEAIPDSGEYSGSLEDLDNLEIPSAEDIQKQLEDALNDLPEEYKDMFGDLGGLFGGLIPGT